MNIPDALHGPEHRVLLCVSTAFDAQVMGNILRSLNARGVFCRGPEEIARQAHGDADAVLVSEEVLDENSLEPIIESFSRQPEWSDLPVLLVRSSGADSPVVLRAMQGLTNILLLDRPVRMAAMTSALIQALRARSRQYRLRDLLKLLRESERKFRTVFEQAAVGIGRVSFDDARWIEVNETFCRMLGYTREELLRTPWPQITHPEDLDLDLIPFRQMAAGELDSYTLEKRYIHKKGHHVWARLTLSLVRDAAGRPDYEIAVIEDITRRKQAETELQDYASLLKASLEEKEILLKEIHHRVKNNMQVISSLIFLQADDVKDADMHNAMEELAHRVRSMAMVHERLYQSEDLARVDFADYARDLLEYLWRAYGSASGGIRLALDLEPVNLPVISAVPCGLILHELVSNAVKHAFSGRMEGKVSVTLRRDAESRVRLQVKDNGSGLPAGMDWKQSASLGLRLVQMLSRQIHATVEVSGNGGTEFRIAFREKKPS